LIEDKEETMKNMLFKHYAYQLDKRDQRHNLILMFNQNGKYEVHHASGAGIPGAVGQWLVRECNNKVLLVLQ